MRHLLTLFAPCLLLVCCEKPAASDNPQNESSTAAQARRRHDPRENNPDAQASLRSLLETAIAIESPAAREKALADVAWSAMETEPELAHDAFHRLPSGSPEKIRLIQHYAMRVAERNPEEAIAWANALETETETAAAIGQIALAIAETDPLRAANLLSESGIAGRDFDVAVVQVIQRWAAHSPPDAAAWVSTFPQGAAREAGIKCIAARWLPADAKSAFAWLEGLKDPAIRSEAARAIEGIILQQPEETRSAWLQQADEKIRSELDQQRENAMKDVGDNIPQQPK